ncbi:xanthine dehydrogenase family protein molybdopterin-binding subunit [Ahrensia sp. R2A130]|uniref:xanthine dehydrogenase family protein molybdopterin-binding subunit n=1 Tax=Ahrensia sp. R2A130 TaxID=744979 RepID=UPI0001E09496|nr:xanthine dehydrogenase family protein molybdopterin-binding subunit [Ahrensia sp. R2A130]EFL88488.1 putative xanthine dehydrogenase YagR molybdenum-binding subunit [Ahrensia sp. R2A130]
MDLSNLNPFSSSDHRETGHLKMDKPDTSRRLDEMQQGVISKSLNRPDGPLKVSGTARYAAEAEADDMATGVLVGAIIPKGRVVSIDEDAAMKMPGVLGVFHGKKLLRNPAQGTANQAPIQPDGEVSYMGQPVALVVAESFEQARDAAITLAITYEEDDDGVFDPKIAEKEKPDGKQIDQGDFDAAMRDAAATVDSRYTTPVQSSAPMEPHASVAQWNGDQLTLHGSYQMLNYNKNELADSLGIDVKNVRILAPYVGGGFGSKLGIAPEAVAAALAAKALERPVRVAMSRRTVFETTMRRSETSQRVQLAADKTGKLLGLAHHASVSNLPDEGFTEPVAAATHFLYGGGSRRFTYEVARLNRSCAGSVRAPGEAVGMLALESAMDELAHELDIDPIELRVRNMPEKHPESDIPYSARNFEDCLRQGAKRFGWADRRPVPASRREGDWWIGVGVAGAARSNILGESKALVTLNADGTALVETDMTDIGTGTYTILAQIAAEMLGLPLEKVTVSLGDSELPEGPGSGGSWGAQSSGSSVYLACEAIRTKVAKALGCAAEDLTLKDGIATGGNNRKPLADLLDGPIAQEGHIEPGATMENFDQAGYGAHFAEVAVNAITGETRVRRMLGVFAAGRILNAQTARSQCHGGMIWGIGGALHEELHHDTRDGHMVNGDLAEYHVPVNLDVPQLDVLFIHQRDDHANPIQAKGIGELGISGAGAAITNAIFNATGVRVRDYPATLDKILPYLPD